MQSLDEESASYSALVAVSRNADLLQALRTEAVAAPALAVRLDASRSTVYNQLTRLTRRGILERTHSRYRLTNVGRLLTETCFEARKRATQLRLADSFLDDIPHNEVPPAAVFDGAEVLSSAAHPGRPALVFDRTMRDAERLRGMIPRVHARHLDATRETPPTNRAGEVLFRHETVAYLLGEYPDRVRESIGTTDLTLLETDRELPFGLVVVEEPTPKMCLSTYSVHGNESGLILNESPVAVEWARKAYEEYRRDATPLVTGSSY